MQGLENGCKTAFSIGGIPGVEIFSCRAPFFPFWHFGEMKTAGRVAKAGRCQAGLKL
jgi:hypothetical protein